ncbi:hypothetical protein EJ03DRAFT_367853, partial [Teratosphaeria nubilosa]
SLSPPLPHPPPPPPPPPPQPPPPINIPHPQQTHPRLILKIIHPLPTMHTPDPSPILPAPIHPQTIPDTPRRCDFVAIPREAAGDAGRVGAAAVSAVDPVEFGFQAAGAAEEVGPAHL